MNKSLVVLAALLALVLPASAAAAPSEGPGIVSVAPDPLVLPATTVGNQGEWLAVDVSYEGEGEAAIDKITVFGEESGEFSSNGSNCGTLFSGQHCTAWFALKPSTLGEKTATLEVRFQGDRPVELRTISGRSVAPQLSFNPSSYDFGIQRVNRESIGASFQLTNSGEAPVQPNNFEINGENDVFWTGSSNCWTLLAPGATCDIQVWFNPHDTRDYSSEVKVWANGYSFGAGLSGRGGRAIVGPAENPVGFGALAVGSAAVKTITLTNSGDLPGAFFIAVIAGGDAGSFQLLSESCSMIELMPTQTCAVRVRFQPQDPGPLSARFAMFGDSDDGTMVFLEGEGLPAAATTTTSSQPVQYLPAPPRKVRKKRFARNKTIHGPSARSSRLRR